MANKNATKTVAWTTEGLHGFDKLKAMVNSCPKLYFINNAYKVVLFTDASDYAHGAYLCQLVTTDGDEILREEPIRLLSGSFSGAQVRWSTIEKEAYAIYWALDKLDDLLGGIAFTIKTDHRNLLYMNKHGPRKVLQWKLDIQHYNAIIEHVPGNLNIPADVFSRLVEKAGTTYWSSDVRHHRAPQRQLIKECHEWLCAHNGVDRTLAILTQYHPSDTAAVAWPTLRHDVREYILSCATCQKMATRHKAIRASRFVLSTLQPMRRKALDTIGPLKISHLFRYI